MNYQEELQAKLAAVRPPRPTDTSVAVDTTTQEERLLGELNDAFEFSRYDLDETDVLRTLKIHHILQRYPGAFSHPEALRLFYVLARVDIITPRRLHGFMGLEAAEFKGILKALARHRLLFRNDDGELELTLDGRSLAERIGIDLFL